MTINISSRIPANPKTNPRKSGINRNKEGSVRAINGKVYVDFNYLGERVREPSGLPWNQKNAKYVRGQLDRIIVEIHKGEFRFATVFPTSKKAEYFIEKEGILLGKNKLPDNVLFKDYVWKWYRVYKNTGRVTPRTLLSYKSAINLYLFPYFGERSFKDINAAILDEFISWARKQRFRGKVISNKSVNKYLVPLKMICKHAAIKYNWGASYNPFFGFKKLPEEDNRSKLLPFSVEEQILMISELPDHWKPYFQFAFCSGLRQGEQIALKPKDIDWTNNLLHIRRAITLDDHGHRMVGKTKNKYSMRTIELLPIMTHILQRQQMICDQLHSDYLFCTPTGRPVRSDNLRWKVWTPALKRAGIPYRPMIQTRHTFATTSLSLGENPLWIAKVMGHRDTNMIIKVYARYLKNSIGSDDGASLNGVYQGLIGKNE